MTVGGRSRPATPVVHIAATRPRPSPAASPTHCFCAPFSFSDAGPDNSFFDDAFDVPVCADDAHMSLTLADTWGDSGGPYPDSSSPGPGIRLELQTRPLPSGTALYGFHVYQDSATTVEYKLFLTFTTGSWSHTLAAQPMPANGDVFELFLADLKTAGASVAATAKFNGATVLSDSRTPPHGRIYKPEDAPGMTVVMFGGRTNAASQSVLYTDWLAEGSC